jgi:hypothetical protein
MKFWRRLFGSGKSAPAAARSHSTRKGLKDAQAVHALLEMSGFTAASEQIERLALPCLDILHLGSGHEAPIGASRLGGAPDLPGDVAWPSAPSGALLSFYGQIDLAEPDVAALDVGLPREGLLSVFVGRFDVSKKPMPVSLLLSPTGSALQRRPSPAPPEAFDDSGTAQLNPVIVGFERRLSFPPLGRAATDALRALCPHGDIDALCDGIGAYPSALGQWLGYAPSVVGDLRESIYFHEAGRTGQERLRIWATWEDWERAKTISSRLRNGTVYRPWSAKDDDNVRWQLAHKAEIEAGVEHWQSMLTIYSNKPMNLWIWDAYPASIFIHANDIARGDVSRVRVITAQG